MVETAVAVKRKEAEGQFDLFGTTDGPAMGLDVAFASDEWDKAALLARERDMLGLYVSDHPLFGLEHVLADATISRLAEQSDGSVGTVGGIISGLQRRVTKRGDTWATATVEDLAGSIECLFFPETYQLVSGKLIQDAIVFVKGRLDKREDVPRLIASEVAVPDLSAVGDAPVVQLELAQANVIPRTVNQLRDVLAAHPGPSEVHLRVRGPEKTTVYRLAFRVDARPGFWADLKAEVATIRVVR